MKIRGFRGINQRVRAVVVAAVLVLAAVACAKPSVGGSFDFPAIGDRLVYVASTDGYLYAVDREFEALSPQERIGVDNLGWERPVGDPRKPKPLIAGPVLVNGPESPMVLVGSEDGNLYAYHAIFGGNPLWKFSAEDRIWSTPVVRDRVVYFGSHDNNLYAVNIVDGEEKWRFATDGAIAGRPLLFRDMVIVGSFDKHLYGVDADDGTLRWRIPGGNWFWAGAVADESTIFAPNMDGNIYAVSGEGRFLWQHDLGSPIVSRPALISSGTGAAGSPKALVVAGKNSKEISLLDTSPGISGADRLLDIEFITDSEIKGPIFVDGNKLYVGTQGSQVYRLDLTARAGPLDLDETWCFDTKSGTKCQ